MRFSQRCRFGLPAGLASHSSGNIGCPSRPYWVGVFPRLFGTLAGSRLLHRPVRIVVVDAGGHAAAGGAAVAGVPAPHVEGDHVARVGGAHVGRHAGHPQVQRLERAADLFVEDAVVRPGNHPQGARVGVDRVQVERELHPVAVLLGIGAVIGMPARVAHVAVGVGADADHVVAVELFGHAAETLVLQEARVQRRARVQHRGPVTLLASERRVRVDTVELRLVLGAQCLHLRWREEVAQDDEPEGPVVLELLVGEHGASLDVASMPRRPCVEPAAPAAW